ncbi:MAG TPA: DotU family type IV/VI secretion system protein [Deltaproteobacteria bacterium]|nr:DotU family type IV/VI secretion system protein [Deltaproteobacteria bacterium]
MRLLDSFIELISYVLYFRKTVSRRQPPFEQVKNDILRLLDSSQNFIKYGEISSEDYDSARFAVCAWIDEIVMNSAWSHRQLWQKELLQRTYYQTTNAGELFFDRLNALALHQKDVREVYYLCLAMGFAGRYCNEGDEFLLEQLKTSNLKVLTGSSYGIPSLDKGELFPEAYPPEAVQEQAAATGRRFSPFNLALAVSPVALFGVLFLIYHFVLRNISKAMVTLVS